MFSVCMATYNGAKYIEEQIHSILEQLGEHDELIIVDDCSTDDTVYIIQSFKDQRIKLFVNQCNMGVNYTFGKSLSLASNDYIFLADQDDIWISGRANKMVLALRSKDVMLVTSNSCYVDEVGTATTPLSMRPKKESESGQHASNIIRILIGTGNYPGCVMAFKSSLLNTVLPFPTYIESHDLWIAKAANLLSSNYHIEEATLYRRIHGSNASLMKRPFLIKIRSRFIFLISIAHLCCRIYKNRHFV